MTDLVDKEIMYCVPNGASLRFLLVKLTKMLARNGFVPLRVITTEFA